MAVVLQKDHLPVLMKELETYLPQTLAIYYVARNIVNDSKLAWPGVQFVVDQFPGHTACVVKPAPDDPEYVPRHSHRLHTVCAKNADALSNFLTTPGVIDWMKPLFFGTLWLPYAKVVTDICRKKGRCIGPEERQDFKAMGVWFSADKLRPGPPPPEGFTVRPLTRAEAKKVNSIWKFGGTATTEEYVLYLHDNGFPTMGIFDQDNQMVGYELCNAEMTLIAAYVAPEHRNRKFFQIISYEWCREMFKMGIERPYAFIAEENIPSHSAMFRLGGERADWNICWVLCIPHDYNEPGDEFLQWVAQLGDVIWKQQ
ncbi:glycine N-acyltransferase-like [Paramacrobiotus metropolitanus]|uniref:glycine N-acyltransferase-like n=1 Tax=Paramacrobiotus metropolitanus TaxID=2943436 RepID=UPI0024462C8A|nr:glycine N-acyltransferase-like [Paramacrobiotus metropolitanus]